MSSQPEAVSQDPNGEVASQDPNAEIAPGLQRQPSSAESFFAITKSLILRALIIYFITSFFRRPQQPTQLSEKGEVLPKVAATNILTDGALIDLYVYMNEEERFSQFDNPNHTVWVKEDLKYGDWVSGPENDGIHSKTITFVPPESLVKNGSIYLHVYVVKSGFSPNPSAGEGLFNEEHTLYTSKRLNKFKRRSFTKTVNLLTGETQLTEEQIKMAEDKEVEIISHWHTNITINMVHDFTQWTMGIVPAPLDKFVEFTSLGDQYKPVMFMNTYWNLVKDYRPLNESVETLDLCIIFQPLSLLRAQFYVAQSMKSNIPGAAILDGMYGEEDDEAQDALKEAFLETSPYLLGLTFAVYLLHSIFEILAFKNDITFWNNRDSLEGLSVRSVFFYVFQSLIVLLYVLDNETNFVIKLSCFVGLGIEVWKITKVMDVTINYERRIVGIPTLKFTDKSTYVHSSTKQYDEMAYRYLGIVLFPLLGCYCIYALLYLEHKSWYSFILSMLYGFLLTFGFIMMTPQLFINYKLKSVAHLPWRMMSYKALNTFIDDIFAFVIKMPTMYRIGCFRDDIIFFIFLYQRYIYRVDPSRLNEFGFSQEMEKDALLKKKNVVEGEEQVKEITNEESKPAEEKKKD